MPATNSSFKALHLKQKECCKMGKNHDLIGNLITLQYCPHLFSFAYRTNSCTCKLCSLDIQGFNIQAGCGSDTIFLCL